MCNADDKWLCKNVLEEDDLVTMYAYDNYVFFKCIKEGTEGGKVRSTNSIDGKSPFKICIHYDGLQNRPNVISCEVEEPYVTFIVQ